MMGVKKRFRNCSAGKCALYLVFLFAFAQTGIAMSRDAKVDCLMRNQAELAQQIAIPNQEGMSIKGIVMCGGKGVKGVTVSDGYEVTQTDDNGIYYLPSEKKHRYVFISVPGNYEVPYQKNLPQFFQRLTGSNHVERKDFFLTPTDNTNHVVLTIADLHLANRNEDLKQFREGFVPDLNATIAEYKTKGMKVYGLTLGDLAWDSFWYKNDFALPQYVDEMSQVNCPIFNVIGNHDNDPYVSGNWESAIAFRNAIAPSYYSFNLGDIHYVVLDNIEYLNDGASEGTIGKRNYNGILMEDQLKWLKKDLATIKDKSTPVVVAMHIPLFSFPKLNSKGEQTHHLRIKNGDKLLDLLQDFNKVEVLTGHTHINYTIEHSESVTEHNTAAVCATWWWTGKKNYAQNHICKDGSPGGYGVWKNRGSDMEWYYKSMGYNKDYQFRTYDLNKVQITAADHAPKASERKLSKYKSVYGESNNSNEILINVWGYDSQWKVEVTENGKPLDIVRVYAKDPLHIISYEAIKVNLGGHITGSFVTNSTAHLFKAKASSLSSTLQVNVTDRFGNVYTEKMVRPKAFNYAMQ